MRRILITGALGHIGSRLIRTMHPTEYDEVLLFDNLSTQRYCSLFDLPDYVPYRFIEGDACTDDLDRHFEGVDVVVHLAAITNAEGSFEIKERVEQVNLVGTERVAGACLRAGCRLVFLSTTSVYGTQSEVVDENCSAEELRPQSPYAASKLRAEQLLESFGRSDGLKYFIGRFGTICGVSPGMRFHTAVNKFCWLASVGQPLTVWRTALDQRRPYLDLTDAVNAIKYVIGSQLFDNQVYNVLTENTTVREIIETIRSFVPDVRVEFVDSRIMNQLSYAVSKAKIERAGFTTRGRLADGIRETIELTRGLRQGRTGNRIVVGE